MKLGLTEELVYYNQNRNICYDINMGRAIGTNGETTIRIITLGILIIS